MKKAFAFLSVSLFAVILLVGCAPSGEKSAAPKEGITAASTTEVTAEAKPAAAVPVKK